MGGLIEILKEETEGETEEEENEKEKALDLEAVVEEFDLNFCL